MRIRPNACRNARPQSSGIGRIRMREVRAGVVEPRGNAFGDSLDPSVLWRCGTAASCRQQSFIEGQVETVDRDDDHWRATRCHRQRRVRRMARDIARHRKEQRRRADERERTSGDRGPPRLDRRSRRHGLARLRNRDRHGCKRDGVPKRRADRDGHDQRENGPAE